MTLPDYLSIDVSGTSSVRNRLFDQIAHESALAEIPVTPDDDDIGANLTPAMKDWLMTNVSMYRGPALQDVVERLSAEKSGRIKGFLLERKLDETNRKKFDAIRSENEKFNADPDLATLRREVETARDRFENMQAEEGGREPVVKDWRLYAAGILFVLVAEGLINFQTFLSLGLFQYLALGLTLLVAGMIAFAAHTHGVTFKQWKATLGGEVHETHRKTSKFAMSVALFGVLVALGIVAWGRDNMITVILERRSLDDVVSLNWVYVGQMAGSLGGNVIV